MSKDISSVRMERLSALMSMLISNCECSKARIIGELEYGDNEHGSTRAFERDLELLRYRFSVEIVYDPAKRGYRCLDAGGFPFTFSASKHDVVALVAGLEIVSHFLPYLKENTSNLWANFKKLIPQELIAQGKQLSDAIAVAIPVSEFKAETLQAIIDAISKKRVLQASYTSPNNIKETKTYHISPWGIYFQGHAWYLWGGRAKYREGASYRLSRISSIVPSDEIYVTPPRGEDVHGYAASAWFAVPGELKHDVKMKISPPLSHIIKETKWHKTQEIENLPDGSVILTARVPHLDALVKWIMNGASLVEALEPQELRDKVAELSAITCRMHG